VREGPCALTHIVLLGRWLGAWCPFLSCCFVVVVVAAVAAAAAAAAVAVEPAGVGWCGAVAEAVGSGQQNLILGAICDSRYHPGTNGKK
jgi:hypothetical protein